MKERIERPRFPSRAEIEEVIAMEEQFRRDEEDEEAADLAEQGLLLDCEPSDEAKQAMADAYFADLNDPIEQERQRLLKLECELDALEAEAEDDAEDVS